MDDLFAPPAYAWQRLSPQYRRMRQLLACTVPWMLASVPALMFGLLGGGEWWWVAAVLWALTGGYSLFRLIRSSPSWTSWGYVEREDDLYITHGVWFRKLIAVPYGRMQLVEVESGPIERAFGLAAISLRTASPETGARIPGLEPGEAARLRDRLTELGESRASGL
ncbi:MAG TPA: PH domain-containing protein [Microlunatus sp.]|nr:PH domain-containing protein [Microlunatus sp.]